MSLKSPATCSLFRGAALAVAFFFPSITGLAQDVLTYHNNNARTEVNNKENDPHSGKCERGHIR